MAAWQWREWSHRLWILWTGSAMWASPAIHVPQLALQVAVHQQARHDREALGIASEVQTVNRRIAIEAVRSSTTAQRPPYREAAQTVSLK